MVEMNEPISGTAPKPGKKGNFDHSLDNETMNNNFL